MKYVLWPQQNEIRKRYQKEIWKFHKSVENKQYSPKWPIGQKQPKGTERYFETNENENTTYQNLWTQGKQCQRENYTHKCLH